MCFLIQLETVCQNWANYCHYNLAKVAICGHFDAKQLQWQLCMHACTITLILSSQGHSQDFILGNVKLYKLVFGDLNDKSLCFTVQNT